MNIVDTIIQQHDYLLLSKPICRRGPQQLLPMFDTRPSSLFRDTMRGLPWSLFEGGGPLTINDCRLESVIWQEGAISLYKSETNARADVISFDFSGCVMAVFCYCGVWYSAHIHMDTPQSPHDCTLRWIEFIQQIRPHLDALGMFRPDVLEFERQVRANIDQIKSVTEYMPEAIYINFPKLWGIVTATGDFISLGVYPIDSSCRRFKVLFVGKHNLKLTPDYYEPLFRPFRSLEEAKLVWGNFWDAHRSQRLFAIERS